MYREMGKALEGLDTWSVYILTSNEQFEEAYGRKATKNENCSTALLKQITINIGPR